MPAAARFTRADVRRLIGAANDAGEREYRVTIEPDGTISLLVGAGATKAGKANSCDDLLS